MFLYFNIRFELILLYSDTKKNNFSSDGNALHVQNFTTFYTFSKGLLPLGVCSDSPVGRKTSIYDSKDTSQTRQTLGCHLQPAISLLLASCPIPSQPTELGLLPSPHDSKANFLEAVLRVNNYRHLSNSSIT